MKPLRIPYTLLALDCSAGPASCAVLRVEEQTQHVLCSAVTNTKLTHSQTLLPMITDMLKNAGMSFSQIDAIAVSVGPGSFTGVRIGVAAVKGLAFANDLPCVAVSTLEGMAARLEGMPYTGKLLTAMDARCQQLYTALFSCANGIVTRVTPDEALPLDIVGERLCAETEPILVIGDGAALCYNALHERVPLLRLAPVGLCLQHAVGVARAAVKHIADGNVLSGEALLPDYLRLPQAQRELILRQKQEKGQ